MKKITALAIVSLLIALPLLIAGVAAAESYVTPMPWEVSGSTAQGIDLTPIFQAVIALIAALITGKLIPWLKSKTTEKQFANLEAAARVAVFAAEQIYGAAEGDKKLDYAVQKLRENGFDLDADLLREAVESVVYGMNYEKRLDVFDEEQNAREADAAEEDEDGLTLPPMEDWPLETLAMFCRDNNVPCEGCATKRDYLRALDKFFGTTSAPEDPAESAASGAPETSAAPEEDSEAPVSEAE